MRRRGLLAGAAVAMGALLLVPSLLHPFGRDQSVFAYVAQVMQQGGLPYRDVWDLKPPGIYFLYRAILGLGGPSMAALRVVDLLWQGVTLAVLYLLGRSFLSPAGAAAAAIWYAACYLRLEFWATAQAESFAALPVLLALWCWWQGWNGRSPLFFLAAGLLGGLAATLKFTVALPLAAPLLALLFAHDPGSPGASSPRRMPVAVLLTVIGIAAPLAAAALWMRWTGCWDAYVEIQRGFVAGYSRVNLHTLPLRGLRSTLDFLLRYVLPALFAAAGVVRLRREGALRSLWLLLGWFGLAAMGVWAQNKLFRYHWTAALPPLCLLAGGGVELVAERLRARWPRVRLAPLALALPVLWSAWVNGGEYVAAARRWSGTLPPRDYLARFGRPEGGDFSFLGDLMAAEYVRAAGTPRRGLFVWGFEPLVYLLSGTRPPTRFIFAAPLVAPWAPKQWRAELMRALRANPPTTILVVQNDLYPWATGRRADSFALLKQFPELERFILSRYQFQQVIEDFVVYRRR